MGVYRRAFKAMIHYRGETPDGHPSAMPNGRSDGTQPIFQLSDPKALTDNSEQPLPLKSDVCV